MPRVAVLAGDGIGAEVTGSAVRVLQAVRPDIEIDSRPFGGSALVRGLRAFPDETRAACRSADAILFGAVGDSRFDPLPPQERPEAALLDLRREFGLYANLRPVRVLHALVDASPLRSEIAADADFVVVRELAGGLYYGMPKRSTLRRGVRTAVDTLAYNEHEVRRVARVAFELATRRRKHVTSVDKSNVLETSRLWRHVVSEVARDYPDVTLEHMLVDTAAMRILFDPSRFDLIVTENTFGDILSDEAAAVVGSIGVLPSASFGDSRNAAGGVFGLFEPIAGSAPDIAGKDCANPIGAISSAAMLLEHSLCDRDASKRIVDAIERVVDRRLVTADLALTGSTTVGTSRFTDLVVDAISSLRAVV